MLERQIERKCVDIAEDHGCLHIKLDLAKRDWPDRMFVCPEGCMLLVEFKRPGEKPRKGQAALHRALEQIGFTVFVVDSVEQFNSLMSRI